MLLSIIHPVLDSHEVVRRQLLHYSANLLADIEVIIVDDGSVPPLRLQPDVNNVKIVQTHSKTPWSEHAARNLGVKLATGKNVFLIDIDYIVPQETMHLAAAFNGDRMDIERRFGVLDADGKLLVDAQTLEAYGLKARWLRKHDQPFPGHRSQFVMNRQLFNKMGGYREDLAGNAHPQGGGAGQAFWNKWRRWRDRGRAKRAALRAPVYMFPVGKFATSEDPLGLFHNLTRHA